MALCVCVCVSVSVSVSVSLSVAVAVSVSVSVSVGVGVGVGVPFLFCWMMHIKYLQYLLPAVHRIKMPVSGIPIFYNSSMYVDLYICTDELRRGFFSS